MTLVDSELPVMGFASVSGRNGLNLDTGSFEWVPVEVHRNFFLFFFFYYRVMYFFYVFKNSLRRLDAENINYDLTYELTMELRSGEFGECLLFIQSIRM